MPRFAANLTMMFNEWDFLDRFAAAADAGFAAVEFLFPYEHPPEAVARQALKSDLAVVNFNLPPGDWAAGDRGLAAVPEREAEFRSGLEQALPYVEATGVGRVHAMAGLASPVDEAAVRTYTANLGYAAERLRERGVDLLIEPLNRRDMPGYFLDDFDRAAEFINTLDQPNLKLQFDIYHRQILHGDVTMGLEALIGLVGHVQIAGVPGRHEPFGEELDAGFVLAELDRLGYQGHVGCEYRPRAGTLAGLGWFARFSRRAG